MEHVVSRLRGHPEGLHLAIFAPNRTAVLKAMLSDPTNLPESLTHPDESGRLPLHYACERVCDSEVIELLVSAYPAGAQVRDKKGMVALHYACEGGCSAKAIECVLKAWPEALSIKFPEPSARRKFMETAMFREIAGFAGLLTGAPEPQRVLLESVAVVGKYVERLARTNDVNSLRFILAAGIPSFVSFQDATGAHVF